MRGNIEPVTCGGKTVFYSYPSAQKASKALNRREEAAHAGPYRCPVCHLYHVGNSLNTKKDKRIYKRSKDVGEEFISEDS